MPAYRPLADAPLPTLIAVPPADPPVPVLCFLHGYDEAAPLPPERGLTRHGPLRPENARHVRDRFVVVAPQLPLAGDRWDRHAEEIFGIVATVHAVHGGDPARTYLTGFSFGGNGVFDLALRRPELWAALWPVDPTRVPPRDPGHPVWLSSGQVSRRAASAFAGRLGLTAPPGPRVLLDEGYDHVGTATSAYGDGRIYDWLLTHRRTAAGGK